MSTRAVAHPSETITLVRGRRWLVPAVLGATVLMTTACGPNDSVGSAFGSSDEVTPVAAGSGSAAGELAALPVKGRAPKTGYDRKQFGPAWADTDHDGCDQRNQVLKRDMENETFKPRTHDCVVMSGDLHDAYTGRKINFHRGKTSSAVQIDHVVALSDAWQKGAQALDADTRERLATDPLNLMAVDGPTNNNKRDGDAATWLPPYSDYRCAYVARQVAVKTKYKLWVTAGERDAIGRILQSCPKRPATTEADATKPAYTLR
ncbi:HNH endonuclease family protein [Pseudonocardia phyllosphaerae]|uniref:HNH endonuclease family protein n=1 Tax=Pseudonocardia phyllosphaerae TaxID=3390502 RepID=UPI0039790D62